jgi:radical SAM-linked protein
MLRESPPVARPAPAARETEKVRIRFRKGGDLRLVSHHDLMTCFERMLRRARLPFRSTQGFHPKPRMAFALSLALGVVGREEVVEIEFDQPLAAAEVAGRLAPQLPPGMEILSIANIDPKTKAQPRRVCYRVAVPVERHADLPDRIAHLMAAPEYLVERTRPRPRRFDLRPTLRAMRLHDGHLEIDLRVDPDGTARPEEILRALGLTDLVEGGAVLERITLELEDEISPTLQDTLDSSQKGNP